MGLFYLKLQLLPATRQDAGEFIFQLDCRSTQFMLVFWHKDFTR